MKREQFEPELSRHLGPVKAPDELWDRVQQQRGTRAGERTRTPAWGKSWIWVAAAAAAIAGLAIGVSVVRNRNLSLEELAVAALGRSPDHLQFRSTEAPAVRAWVKSGTGLDVPMPSALFAGGSSGGSDRGVRQSTYSRDFLSRRRYGRHSGDFEDPIRRRQQTYLRAVRLVSRRELHHPGPCAARCTRWPPPTPASGACCATMAEHPPAL